MSDITQKWVDVVKPFTRDYSVKMTASEISKLSKTPQQTASRILNSLVKLNLICYEVQGKNKLFYFDRKKMNTHSLFVVVEEIKSVDFNFSYPKEFLVINKLKDCCEGVIVFGSYASGKAKKDSDLDVVLIEKCNKKKLSDIKSISHVNIHEQVVSYDEFMKKVSDKHPLALEIFDNHVLFGDVSKIVNLFWSVKNG